MSGLYGASNQIDTSGGFASFSRVQQALRATNTTTCTVATGGCAPLNLFGAAGTISDAAVAFVTVQNSTTTNTSFVQAIAALDGDLGSFRSPFASNPIGVSFGVEFRQNGAQTFGDFLSQQPGEVLGAGGSSPTVNGGTNVVEGFVETIIPLAENLPLVHKLSIEAGTRLSSYNNTGFSATWKAGSTWEVIEGYKLRGVFQRAVRAPNVNELFSPVITGLGNLDADPCSGSAPVANAALRAICLRQGAPASTIGVIDDPIAGQVNITSGGNPNLDVERASTLTLGVVTTPKFLKGFTFTLDYFNIFVNNAISSPAEGDIVDNCFLPSLNPSLTFNAACASIARNPVDGSLNGSAADTLGLILPTSNSGRINTSGLDWSAAYAYNFSALGRLSWNINGTWTFQNRFQASPFSIDRECIRYYSTNCGNIQPRFQFNERLSWSLGRFDASIQHRYLGRAEVEPLVDAPIPAFSVIKARHYFDLTGRVQLFKNTDFTLVVDNLINSDPPIVGTSIGTTAFNSGNTYPTVYDALGRRFTMAFHTKF